MRDVSDAWKVIAEFYVNPEGSSWIHKSKFGSSICCNPRAGRVFEIIDSPSHYLFNGEHLSTNPNFTLIKTLMDRFTWKVLSGHLHFDKLSANPAAMPILLEEYEKKNCRISFPHLCTNPAALLLFWKEYRDHGYARLDMSILSGNPGAGPMLGLEYARPNNGMINFYAMSGNSGAADLLLREFDKPNCGKINRNTVFANSNPYVLKAALRHFDIDWTVISSNTCPDVLPILWEEYNRGTSCRLSFHHLSANPIAGDILLKEYHSESPRLYWENICTNPGAEPILRLEYAKKVSRLHIPLLLKNPCIFEATSIRERAKKMGHLFKNMFTVSRVQVSCYGDPVYALNVRPGEAGRPTSMLAPEDFWSIINPPSLLAALSIEGAVIRTYGKDTVILSRKAAQTVPEYGRGNGSIVIVTFDHKRDTFAIVNQDNKPWLSNLGGIQLTCNEGVEPYEDVVVRRLQERWGISVCASELSPIAEFGFVYRNELIGDSCWDKVTKVFRVHLTFERVEHLLCTDEDRCVVIRAADLPSLPNLHHGKLFNNHHRALICETLGIEHRPIDMSNISYLKMNTLV
jgi:hypothetical protein